MPASREPSSIPFVFQIATALRDFLLQHSGEKSVDLSIGTPPTSVNIRAKQLEILFGAADDPFAENSPEAELFRALSLMVWRMGKYESAGGCMEMKSWFGLTSDRKKEATVKGDIREVRETGEVKEVVDVTVISGGTTKALELWNLVKPSFGDRDAMVSRHQEEPSGLPLILSTPLLERCSLALFYGEPAMVAAMEGLHTALLGTPSAVQEDLFLMLSSEHFRSLLEKLDDGNFLADDEMMSDGFRATLEYMALIAREPFSQLKTEGNRLKKIFAHQFLTCFFEELSRKNNLIMACGNGGGREALHHIETILLEEGVEHMILFQPHWTYSNVYTRLDLQNVPVMADGQPNFGALTKMLTKLTHDGHKKNVAITINSPNNPSGIMYSCETLQQLLQLAQGFGIFLVDDACYVHIVRQDESYRGSLVEAAAEMIDQKQLDSSVLARIFTALTVSKGLGMAGARLGGVLYGAEKFTARLEAEYERELPNLMAFFLANQLTRDPKAFQLLLAEINREVDARVKKVTAILDQHGWLYRKPAGAFYLEVKVPFLEKRVDDMKKFALNMAREKGIAFMPMEVFGGERYAIRLSLGGEKSPEQLQEEIEVLIENLKNV